MNFDISSGVFVQISASNVNMSNSSYESIYWQLANIYIHYVFNNLKYNV